MMKLQKTKSKLGSIFAALLNREKFSFAGFFSTETLGFFSNFAQKSGGLFSQKKSAALNRKKHARHVFIHRGGSLFTIALFSALLFAQCANVKGIFTEDRSSGPAPDPSCADAPQSSGFNEGDGASEDTPYLICTYAQLGMMGDDLSAHYAVGGNIDASSSNWTPVGDNSTGDDSSRFTGTLDGRDYMISGLMVNITGDYGGLFGYTGEHAEIRSVGLSGVNVMAGSSSGGLVGQNNGDIRNSYATGTVSSTTGHSIGGLAGYNNGSISSSYSTATADSTINIAGGLVGRNTGTISNSYATGVLSAQNNIGGLVGQNDGSISSSYSTGMARASVVAAAAGGLVGTNGGGGNISNSYAAGTASSTAVSPIFLGGLAGVDNGGTGALNGINYFADNVGGANGLGTGSCDAAVVCVQATGSDDAARAAWLADSLDETDDSGLNWDAELDAEGNAVWGNLNAAGFPCLKNMPDGAEPCS